MHTCVSINILKHDSYNELVRGQIRAGIRICVCIHITTYICIRIGIRVYEKETTSGKRERRERERERENTKDRGRKTDRDMYAHACTHTGKYWNLGVVTRKINPRLPLHTHEKIMLTKTRARDNLKQTLRMHRGHLSTSNTRAWPLNECSYATKSLTRLSIIFEFSGSWLY